MKKNIAITVIIFFFVLLYPIKAFAGELNEFEQKFVDILSFKYEYKGFYYIVAEEYIEKVINYLSRDDIDWTEEEYIEYRDVFLDNFDYGIAQGYMIKVGPIPKPTPRPQPTPEQTQEDEGNNDDYQDDWSESEDTYVEPVIEEHIEEIINLPEALDEEESGEIMPTPTTASIPTVVPIILDEETEEMMVATSPVVTPTVISKEMSIVTEEIDTSDYVEVYIEPEYENVYFDKLFVVVVGVILLSSFLCVRIYKYIRSRNR